MPKTGKLIAQWDEADVIQAQVEAMKESGMYPDKTDEELSLLAAQDPDLFAIEWADLCDDLTELMKRNGHGGWRAVVNNFGWRALNGYKIFRADNGKELLRQVLPDTECTCKIFKYGNGLAINNAHHDSPCWAEWYYILPFKEAA